MQGKPMTLNPEQYEKRIVKMHVSPEFYKLILHESGEIDNNGLDFISFRSIPLVVDPSVSTYRFVYANED